MISIISDEVSKHIALKWLKSGHCLQFSLHCNVLNSLIGLRYGCLPFGTRWRLKKCAIGSSQTNARVFLHALILVSLSLSATIAHELTKRQTVSLKMAIIKDIISIYVIDLRYHRLTFINIRNDDVCMSNLRSKMQRIFIAKK